MRRTGLGVALAAALLAAGGAGAAEDGDPYEGLRPVPVQHGGRVKPFDAFCREMVRRVSGSESWRPRDPRTGEPSGPALDPVAALLSWISDPGIADRPLFRIALPALRERLALDPGREWFSFREIQQAPGFDAFARAAGDKQRREEGLTSVERAALQVAGSARTLSTLAIPIVPHGPGKDGACETCRKLHPGLGRRALEWESARWFSPFDPGDDAALEAHHAASDLEALRSRIEELRGLFAGGAPDPARVREAGRRLREALGAFDTPAAPVDRRRLDREVFLNRLHPIRWAFLGYLAGGGILLCSLGALPTLLRRAGLAAILAALGVHSWGIALRCAIAGRPPVSNMYESVIWVALGAVLFSLLFFAVYRRPVFPLAAAFLASVLLFLADRSPGILDPSIDPLVPSLMSNFWLAIHVPTITLSYAAFLLALGVGHWVLALHLFAPARGEAIDAATRFLYRNLQAGVLLLAAGTILGGVWASYAWNRFWGFDPKETWAAIALLLYLVPLHARFVGLIGRFGLAVASVVCFQGVLMSWYGVNFVLGKGLHSYGFSVGGRPLVGAFLIAEYAFLSLAAARRAFGGAFAGPWIGLQGAAALAGVLAGFALRALPALRGEGPSVPFLLGLVLGELAALVSLLAYASRRRSPDAPALPEPAPEPSEGAVRETAP